MHINRHYLTQTARRAVKRAITLMFVGICAVGVAATTSTTSPDLGEMKSGFSNPPDSAKPGVYWYFMDGNISREGMTRDLESMKESGIAHVVFLEVNVGVPRGQIDFLSDAWLDLFKHANEQAERLGISITLGTGPGWAGSGGPWVEPELSMQHLVASQVEISGADKITTTLPVPAPRKPFFGEGTLTPELRERWNDYYKDVAVLAFPTPSGAIKVPDIDEKALYYRAPYTSVKGVKPRLPARSSYDEPTSSSVINTDTIIDITAHMQPDGELTWDVPPGEWTIMRFGARNNGAITRPAPAPGLGFEADKFDSDAFMAHLEFYVGKILDKIGPLDTASPGGLAALHIDSWEMGAQNWTPKFREEFRQRRGYDPLPWYPAYLGLIVDSPEATDRFLWDLRQTSQELVLENHAGALKEYAHDLGLKLSIEPYDMNPSSDLELGAVADIPMCEFWSKGYGFNSAFSCLEATSIGHVNGSPVIQAEAFTGDPGENWNQYPGSMKNQGDWAFALGINRFFYHTFAHQALDESLLPGMTMGPYGVHWDRHQTWWSMVDAYHEYVSRCQYLLQQGRPVADILYLTPEGAPQVFVPPPSALVGDAVLPDKRGYNFDGCAPGQLLKASVEDGKIVFPGGAAYRVLVLPAIDTMTLEMLKKIGSLVKAGAVVVGAPPSSTPGLSGYPESEAELKALVQDTWGNNAAGNESQTQHQFGKGRVVWGGALAESDGESLFPAYEPVAQLLSAMDIKPDFMTPAPVRYHHRSATGWDMYFVSNKTTAPVSAVCAFRTSAGAPTLWNPMTGQSRPLPDFSAGDGVTTVPLKFESEQSYFVVFAKNGADKAAGESNFSDETKITTLEGPWNVSFDPQWGAPAEVEFAQLVDWTDRPEDGIQHYSGTATYRKSFDLPADGEGRLLLDLGEFNSMARVRLNGRDLGVVWTNPPQVDITDVVKPRNNELEIDVANLWPNRMIGDMKLPDDGIKNTQWPEWVKKGESRPSERFTFSTYQPFKADTPLLKSGLLGPVTIHHAVKEN